MIRVWQKVEREFRGKNIDAAIASACEEFGVPREKLIIEIVTPGRPGFLGIFGGREAVVRARLLDWALSADGESKENPAPENGAEDLPLIKIRDWLEGLIGLMGMEAQVEATGANGVIYLKIETEEPTLVSEFQGPLEAAWENLLWRTIATSTKSIRGIKVRINNKTTERTKSPRYRPNNGPPSDRAKRKGIAGKIN